MFDSIGWGEIVVLALAALFIFGPERLPSLSREAAGALGRVRGAVSDIRHQVGEHVGEDLAPLRDLDVRRYHPRTFLREQILGDGPDRQVTSPARVSGAGHIEGAGTCPVAGRSPGGRDAVGP